MRTREQVAQELKWAEQGLGGLTIEPSENPNGYDYVAEMEQRGKVDALRRELEQIDSTNPDKH